MFSVRKHGHQLLEARSNTAIRGRYYRDHVKFYLYASAAPSFNDVINLDGILAMLHNIQDNVDDVNALVVNIQ
ncbi:hypothetical protein A2U01_0015304 [Trifolium medium]|uniref:Uncharacterized protein n=1 Tax=Trifolium medium TaxID=97028 RepID=A0A392N3F1_9FABA|nr:hypothetical protein [Trifolium medium]